MANAIITIEAPDRFIEAATSAAIDAAKNTVNMMTRKERAEIVKQELEKVFDLADKLHISIAQHGGRYVCMNEMVTRNMLYCS